MLAACALVATACTENDAGSGDELQIVENPVAASPADSPERTAEPAGDVIGTGDDVTAVAIEPDSGALAVATGSAVRFYQLSKPRAKPKEVEVPGPIERLVPTGDGRLAGAIPSEKLVVSLSPESEQVTEVAQKGEPAGVARLGAQTLVALRDSASVAVLEDGKQVTTISGAIASADQVLVADGQAVVLDRLRSAIFEVDVAAGEIGLGLRAGQGAANAVTDRFGRVLVVDTRTAGLLAFSLDPLVLRQRYPVPGRPYAIAYDAERDLAWVTLTERNELVGFDVAGGEPTEQARFPTVRQPNSVTVDERTGSVVVASGDGEGIQVIEP
ncbi:MAG: hypothetical protein GEU86_11615 [Actinophytocola sp.]|nr:hypothetical protein [Actinophytocola sp.]